MRFDWRFRKAPFSQRSNVNARQKVRFHMNAEQCERHLSKYSIALQAVMLAATRTEVNTEALHAILKLIRDGKNSGPRHQWS